MDPGGWDGMGWDGMGWVIYYLGKVERDISLGESRESNILYGKDGALSNILYGKDGALSNILLGERRTLSK